MTSAAFFILYMKLRVEIGSILYCSIGGTFGVIFGLEIIAPSLEPAYSKMYFGCIWFTFATALVWFNLLNGRDEVAAIAGWNHYSPVNWRAPVLTFFGFIGGIFSAIGGSGLDICSFAVLTLLFRVSARVATPTSVVLMAINSVIAFLYRLTVMDAVDPEVYSLWLVCIPVVVVGAPLGALVSSHFHSHVLATLVIAIDTAQLIGALYVVQPWITLHTEQPAYLCISSALVLLGGAGFFTVLSLTGLKMHRPDGTVQREFELVEQISPLHKEQGETP